ncbi:pyrrolo-quinoline quinone [Mycobacterium sp. CBMA 234]|uniref:outer membrane protein assembly factor BamB family protein n=1 Tax=Mycolicibacterium sp. CBMA 234 TaxID=1918495 RepID=UPI0012DE8311|nr:PQQ-binding-like beta-propeller repeat protein [Mycolicibacterium sp. CBMA 234]MUL63672.1 pyrrolo-quinoline quinone [Mycolicibacterium sp. CBMA 234]
MPAHRLRRLAALTIAAATLTVAGCGNTDSWVQAHPSDGWPAQYGDAANSSYTALAGASTLKQDWARSAKGSIGAQVILGSGSYLAINAQSANGCSLMVWESDQRGRQRWCTRLWPGGGMSSPLFDGFDNMYVGQPGAIMSFPPTQWIRWRQPVIGMPMTPRILSPGQLLVVTHLGQVLVFDAHRGQTVGAPLDLVSGVDPTDSARGLADCQPAKAACPISAAPAYSPDTNMIVLGLWQPNTDAPSLVGLRYHEGQTPLLTREWTSTAVGGGPIASPVLSADGKTIYVSGRDQHLWALNSADGKAKWSVDLGFQPQTPPSVTPDGLVVAGGGPHTKLTAVKDKGDKGDVAWTRGDVEPLTTSTRAGSEVGYAVVTDGDHPGQAGQALLVFSAADGHTLNSYPLPGATGWPVGVSVGHDKRVVTATSDGQVYAFAPA